MLIENDTQIEMLRVESCEFLMCLAVGIDFLFFI